ncbi:response regulator [Bacillus sonorensis]|nr:response regulator [Bacillus sonorensis]
MNDKWRVLIADDEPWIREGIRDAVSWERYYMEVSAEAENGEEAFELALQHSIDLLIVDLNMPIVNGLNLMKKLRQALPRCRFVIVTGYDQFSYAQEAIRLQVDDYLLKPVEPGQLDKVLRNISSSLASEKQKQREQILAERHIQHNLGLLKVHFLTIGFTAGSGMRMCTSSSNVFSFRRGCPICSALSALGLCRSSRPRRIV